jgi:hypothetical protein
MMSNPTREYLDELTEARHCIREMKAERDAMQRTLRGVLFQLGEVRIVEGTSEEGTTEGNAAVMLEQRECIRELEVERDAALKRAEATTCCELCDRFDGPGVEPPGYVVCPWCWQARSDKHVVDLAAAAAMRGSIHRVVAAWHKNIGSALMTECLEMLEESLASNTGQSLLDRLKAAEAALEWARKNLKGEYMSVKYEFGALIAAWEATKRSKHD